MASLGQVAKKAGVTPRAVRMWLERENLADTCYDSTRGTYRIPPDTEKLIIDYYQEKQVDTEGCTKGDTTGDTTPDTIRVLTEQLAIKDRQITDLTDLLRDTHQLLGEAQRRLEASQTLQAHTQGYIAAPGGSQQFIGEHKSPPVQRSGLVADFVSRLVGRKK